MTLVDRGDPPRHHVAPGVAERVRRAVASSMRDVCEARYGSRLRAVVLTGSVARDEATIVEEGPRLRVLGDAEFIAVFAAGAKIPAEAELRALEADVAARLSPDVECPISVGGVAPSYLRRLRPHIFGHELRVCGEVVHGDTTVLDLIPPFGAGDIPREDAWRLLANRMIEFLEVAVDAVPLAPVPPAHVQYRVAKLALDLATSWLVFVGAYRPTYRARAAAVRDLAERGGVDAPFDLARFAADVEACTAFKLDGADLDDVRALGRRTLDVARALWRWELARLADLRAPASDDAALAAFARRQSLATRLRGWAVVVREGRRLGPTARWTRWRQALGTSPRLRVYGVAASLIFALGDPTAEPAIPVAAIRRWQRMLPLSPVDSPGPTRRGWRRLAADVAWNYRAFLVGTQA